MFSKLFIQAAAVISLLSSCSSSADDPQPSTSGPAAGRSPIAVKISEAGAPSYSLNDAYVVSSNYQTGASSLTITGKLNSGKVLTLNFTKVGSASPNTTNALDATLDNVAGSSATGTTAFNTQGRTVDGSFQVTFPIPGAVSGSFAGVALP